MEGSQVSLTNVFASWIKALIWFVQIRFFQELVFPKTTHGTGSLYLDRVSTQHAGRLTCVAVSAAGSALHTATLQVVFLSILFFSLHATKIIFKTEQSLSTWLPFPF